MIRNNQDNELLFNVNYAISGNSYCNNINIIDSLNDSSSINKNIAPSMISFDNILFPIFGFENINFNEQINFVFNNQTYSPSNNKSEVRPRFSIKNRKRGRKGEIKEKKKAKIIRHDKNTSDNLLTKVQVHYINFIKQFLNDIIKYFKYDKEFYNIDYKFKSNIKKEFVNYLKNCKIEDIIKTKISNKYKRVDKNYNKNVYLYYINQGNNVLKKIFSENYLLLFRKIYYKSNKIINLKDYGLDAKIELSPGIKMYKDLLKEEDDKINNKEYKSNLIKCINQHFFSNSRFETNN